MKIMNKAASFFVLEKSSIIPKTISITLIDKLKNHELATILA